MPPIKYVDRQAKCMLCGKPCITSDPCYCAEHSNILVTYKCLICGNPCLGHNRFCSEECFKQGEVILKKNECTTIPDRRWLDGFVYKCAICGREIEDSKRTKFCSLDCQMVSVGGESIREFVGDEIDARFIEHVRWYICKQQSKKQHKTKSKNTPPPVHVVDIKPCKPQVLLGSIEPETKRKCHDCGKPTTNYRCRECSLKWKIKNRLGLTSEDLNTAAALNINVQYRAENNTDDLDVYTVGIDYRDLINSF